MFVIRQRFWWPSMWKEVTKYMAACPVCPRSKISSRGLLQLLPAPWSHIQGECKMAHFIPLGKLPSAKETAEVVGHRFPSDIVSDRGPQIISTFWKGFCQCLGATVSLSSGYHPQSNRQSGSTRS